MQNPNFWGFWVEYFRRYGSVNFDLFDPTSYLRLVVSQLLYMLGGWSWYHLIGILMLFVGNTVSIFSKWKITMTFQLQTLWPWPWPYILKFWKKFCLMIGMLLTSLEKFRVGPLIVLSESFKKWYWQYKFSCFLINVVLVIILIKYIEIKVLSISLFKWFRENYRRSHSEFF